MQSKQGIMFSIRCGMNQTKLKPCTAYCNPVDAHRFLTMKYWVPGTQDYMTKSKISSHPKAKIGCLWHPGTLKHSPVDVNWSLKNSYYPSYLFLLVLGAGLQFLLDQVMIIHVYEPQEILMNNTCLKKIPHHLDLMKFSCFPQCRSANKSEF